MLTLWMFGVPLEQDWGTRRFLKYYFICGIGAGLCDVAAERDAGQLEHQHHRRLRRHLRAAAGVRRLYPNQTVLMSFLFPIKAKYMVMIYAGDRVVDVARAEHGRQQHRAPGRHGGGVRVPERPPARHAAQAAGLAGAYRQWKLQRAKRKFQVYMRKHGGGPWVN